MLNKPMETQSYKGQDFELIGPCSMRGDAMEIAPKVPILILDMPLVFSGLCACYFLLLLISSHLGFLRTTHEPAEPGINHRSVMGAHFSLHEAFLIHGCSKMKARGNF